MNGTFVWGVRFVTHRLGGIVRGAVIGGAVVAVTLLLLPRSYTARVVFAPDTGADSPGGLAGLAAQFGVAFGGGSAAGPEFYADFVQSWPVLDAVARSRFTVLDWYSFVPWAGRVEKTGDFGELLKIKGQDLGRRREKVVRALQSALATRVNRETGTVNLAVRTRWPSLSRQVAERVVAIVDSFNVNIRTSRAAVERRFVDSRVAEADDSLRAAEAQLEWFLTRNRDFRNSPQLAFEHSRLERQVAAKQGVVSLLRQALEQSRIEEVRSTPVITIVETPRTPGLPDRRYMIARALLGAVVGSVLVLVVALWRAFMSAPAETWDHDVGMLRTTLAELPARLKDIFRRRKPGADRAETP